MGGHGHKKLVYPSTVQRLPFHGAPLCLFAAIMNLRRDEKTPGSLSVAVHLNQTGLKLAWRFPIGLDLLARSKDAANGKAKKSKNAVIAGASGMAQMADPGASNNPADRKRT